MLKQIGIRLAVCLIFMFVLSASLIGGISAFLILLLSQPFILAIVFKETPKRLRALSGIVLPLLVWSLSSTLYANMFIVQDIQKEYVESYHVEYIGTTEEERQAGDLSGWTVRKYSGDIETYTEKRNNLLQGRGFVVGNMSGGFTAYGNQLESTTPRSGELFFLYQL